MNTLSRLQTAAFWWQCVRWLTGALFFFLPLQTRKVIAIVAPYSHTIFPEWGTIFLYGTDIVLVLALCAALVAWIMERKATDKPFIGIKAPLLQKRHLVFLGLAIFLCTNIAHAVFPILGIIQILRVTTLIVLGGIILRKKIVDSDFIFYSLLLSSVVQYYIAVVQFITQKSIGLKLLGESVLSTDINNIAELQIAGSHILRAYGTFPHPNIFGGFMVLLFGAFFLFLQQKRSMNRKHAYLFVLVFLMLVLESILTFSRISWLAIAILAVACLFCLVRNVSRETFYKTLHDIKLPILALCIGMALIVYSFAPYIFSRFHLTSDAQVVETTVQERHSQFTLAWKNVSRETFLGVGMGNYVPSLYILDSGLREYEYQPVHNIFALLIVELGIPLFLMLFLSLLALLIQSIRTNNNIYSIGLLGAVILLASFDHFLLTSQQGRLILFSFVLLILLQKQKNVSRETF